MAVVHVIYMMFSLTLQEYLLVTSENWELSIHNVIRNNIYFLRDLIKMT